MKAKSIYAFFFVFFAIFVFSVLVGHTEEEETTGLTKDIKDCPFTNLLILTVILCGPQGTGTLCVP